MPLTSMNKVQKKFPSIFAEKMFQHVKQRAQSYTEHRGGRGGGGIGAKTDEDSIMLGPLDNDAEISEMCDSDGEICANSLGHSHSRLTPEISVLRPFGSATTPRSTTSESGSDFSSTTTTPRPSSSPSPRGFPVNVLESPRPQTSGSFVPTSVGMSPRRPRSRHSPRTTNSLDNVDLWEEDESDSTEGYNEHFDNIEGIMIDPLKTFDFSDLRRSKSPVECKRNKLSNDGQMVNKREVDRGKSPRGKSPREKQQSTARARAARRLKQLFPNPAVTKPRLHIAKPHTDSAIDHNKRMSKLTTVETPITTFPLAKQESIKMVNNSDNTIAKDTDAFTSTALQTTTSKNKLLPQRESRLAAKFPMAPATEDISSGNKSTGISTTPVDKTIKKSVADKTDLFLKSKPPKENSTGKSHFSSKIEKAATISKCSDIISSVSVNKDNEPHSKLPTSKPFQGKKKSGQAISELEKLRRIRRAFNGLNPSCNGLHPVPPSDSPDKPVRNSKILSNYSLNSTGDSDKSNKDYSPNSTGSDSPARKVKFNSFVSVREDELNTLDFLKHSNDSAQMFKNRYLKASNIDSNNKNGFDNSDSNMIHTLTF